jgi:hypothetical protein
MPFEPIKSVLQIMKHRGILIFFLGSFALSAMGQADPLLKRIFFDLDPNISRSLLCKKAKESSLFEQIINASDTLPFSPTYDTYYCKVRSSGIVKTESDSIRMQISFGMTAPVRKSENKATYSIHAISYNYSYIALEYFFHSAETADHAFNDFTSMVEADGKLLGETGQAGTSGKSTSGKVYYYVKDPPETELRILKMALLNHIYSLRIEYARPDK